jgi:DNA-binding NtrC family response regulator
LFQIETFHNFTKAIYIIFDMSEKEGKILVIDDDKDVQITAKMILKKHYGVVDTIEDPVQLKKYSNLNDYNLILLDMNFSPGVTSGEEGLYWLKEILKFNPNAIVLMITAYGDIDLAVKAMKLGATNFIVKPWDNKKLLATIASAYKLSCSQRKLEQSENTKNTLARDIDQTYGSIIGNSEPIRNLFKTINKIAATDVNVLLLGENGTGKELIAREIHKKSNRAGGVFMNVDLGAISENLFESELFGHVKGAFTDAKEDRMGRFEMAEGGTLFLDEIGNLSLPLQSKLLTSIQNRSINRVGSGNSVAVNVRLICATNMPLKQMVEKNEFRQDLLYRINTVEIEIPPLRSRADDIPDLAAHFLKLYKNRYRKSKLSLQKSALKKLQDYKWPGNVRELQHVIERAVIMAEDQVIKPKDLILDNSGNNDVMSNSLNLEEVEKSVILKALNKHNFNLSAAARELGLGRTTLYRKMNKYEL